MAVVFDPYVPSMAGPKAASGSGLAGGSTGQIKTYTSDPTSEGVLPADTSQPAVAYKSDGSGAMYNWVVATQSWA